MRYSNKVIQTSKYPAVFLKFVLVFVLAGSVNATQQQPDILYYDGKKLMLSTGWGHPSPLQTYYQQADIEYPFSILHSANYRGHVAIWEISKGQLFLNEIDVKGAKYKPWEFDIHSDLARSSDGEVFSNWFSGVLKGYFIPDNDNDGESLTYYFHLRFGEVVNAQSFTSSEIEKIYEAQNSGNISSALKTKSELLQLNTDYIAYYFRLNNSDSISYNRQVGYFGGKNQGSPLLLRYPGGSLEWPFNWENRQNNGAPNCEWVVEGDKVYLKKVNLYSGLGFYEIDISAVEMKDLFNTGGQIERVLATWLTGVFLVTFGEVTKTESEFEFDNFKVSKYVFLRLNSGEVVESHFLPGDFDFESIPAGLGLEVQKIISDFND